MWGKRGDRAITKQHTNSTQPAYMHVYYHVHPFQEELRKFIKFACNQERIPFGHPCRDGAKDSAMNVPPYPMKIAPPDGSGEQYIESLAVYSSFR